MNLSKKSICSKSEFERLLADIEGKFIYDGNKEVTKQEIVSQSKRIATHFEIGDVISNSLKNSPEWWMLTLAGIFAGATVIVYPNEKNKDDIISENVGYNVKRAFFAENDVCPLLEFEGKRGEELSYNGRLVLFTSGTQSRPKGVVIEMDNYIPNLIATQKRLHMRHSDINAGMSPYSHAMGFMYGSCDFFYGGDFIMCRNQLEFTNLIINKKADIASMQPIYLESMIKLESFVRAVSSMRYVLIGGAPMSQGAYELYCRSGTRIVNGYGMTECVAGIAVTDSESNSNNDRSLDIMESSIIKISEEGEILVSGPTVCKKYINGDPTVGADGWYHTHDIGYIREGRLYVTGRQDNVIVCENGYKISLEGIEDKLLRIDGIDACMAEYIDKCLVISVVSALGQKEIYALVDPKMEYYERPFRIKTVEKLEVHNGKKLRRYK